MPERDKQPQLEDEAPRPLVPPEPTIWRKYSRHHEFPISTIMSVVLHLFTALTIATFGAILFNWGGGSPPEVDNVVFAGGGGSGDGGGDPTSTPRAEAALPDVKDLSEGLNLDAIDLSKLNELATPRPIEESKKTQELVQGISKAVSGSAGRGGPGSGGGKGTGHGTGEGSGSGPGKGNARQRRADRWELVFNYRSADEYIRNYASILAYVAVRESSATFRFFEDFSKKPYQGRVITLAELNKTNKRVYFTTFNKSDLLAAKVGLGLETQPELVAVFIPSELETELGKKELAHRNLTLREIDQKNIRTLFRVHRVGDKWEIQVVNQGPG